MAHLKLTEIEALRAESAPLPLTPAPFTSSEQFKSPYTSGKPLAKRWDYHFSIESRGFAGSTLKKESSPAGPRKIISLGTGRRTAEYYPWESFTFHGVSPVPVNPKASDGVGHSVHTVSKHGAAYNLSIGLNYSHANGSPHLLQFITEHVELVHHTLTGLPSFHVVQQQRLK